jgi:hypothetical protein
VLLPTTTEADAPGDPDVYALAAEIRAVVMRTDNVWRFTDVSNCVPLPARIEIAAKKAYIHAQLLERAQPDALALLDRRERIIFYEQHTETLRSMLAHLQTIHAYEEMLTPVIAGHTEDPPGRFLERPLGTANSARIRFFEDLTTYTWDVTPRTRYMIYCHRDGRREFMQRCISVVPGNVRFLPIVLDSFDFNDPRGPCPPEYALADCIFQERPDAAPGA